MSMQVLPQTPKGQRLSLVALAGAAMALLWAILEWAGVEVPAPVISALTSLVMLLAGFYDHKNKNETGEPPYTGDGSE
jgi:hypothetical protein